MNTKRSPIIYLYPHITHLRHKEGDGPLCNAQGVDPKNIVEEGATCRSCNKRKKRGTNG